MRASVIVPTRNRGTLVLDAVRSALDSGVADEVIVVDGGSADGSLDELQALGDRIRLIEGAFENAAATRNAGAAAAQGRFLAFLDSDDLMTPEKVSCLAPILERDESIALAHGALVVIDQIGAVDAAATAEHGRQLGEGARRGTSYDALAAYCALYTSATLIRRSAFEAIGGYDESLDTYEDWDLYLRLSLDHRLVYADCIVASYRIWPGNVAWDRTAAGVAAVAEKHLASLPREREDARYWLLRRLATASHVLLDGRRSRRAALAALRTAPLRGLADSGVRGTLLRSLIPSGLVEHRRPGR
jgi:glycosyltransferase involved in cell wall biosynthesis